MVETMTEDKAKATETGPKVDPKIPIKIISQEECDKHNTEEDCWIAVHGRVLDMTKFLDEHPGGPQVILEMVNGDASQEFEDIGHSDAARRLATDYIVGVLEGHEEKKGMPIPFNSEISMPSQGGGTGVMIGVLAVVVGAALYFMHAKDQAGF